MTGALAYGCLIVGSFLVGVALMTRRQCGRIGLTHLLSYKSVPRYILDQVRRHGLGVFRQLDLLAFLFCFTLIAIMFLLPLAFAMF